MEQTSNILDVPVILGDPTRELPDADALLLEFESQDPAERTAPSACRSSHANCLSPLLRFNGDRHVRRSYITILTLSQGVIRTVSPCDDGCGGVTLCA